MNPDYIYPIGKCQFKANFSNVIQNTVDVYELRAESNFWYCTENT